MKPIIDYIQITVKNMKIAEPFYDKLMPILGYSLTDKISAVIEEHGPYYYAMFFKDSEGSKYEIVFTPKTAE